MSFRHSLANGLYLVAGRLDKAVEIVHGGYKIGTEPQYATELSPVTVDASVHTRDETPIWGDFQPQTYSSTYAALHVGSYSGARVTVFLNRRTTRRLLRVLTDFDGLFNKHGEGE